MPKRKSSESGIQSPKSSSKRKKKSRVEAENSGTWNKILVEDQNQFHELWELKYFVIQSDEQAICLICRKVLPAIKKSDIEQHYVELHEGQFSDCTEEDKIEILKKLKNSNCLIPLLVNSPGRPKPSKMAQIEPIVEPEREKMTPRERRMSISYAISLTIAREGRPYTDGSAIKKSSIEYAREIGDKQMIQDYESLALSKVTVSRRISDLNNYIEQKIKLQLENCQYFSLCLCEKIHENQLMIFVRITQSDFTTSEEMLNFTSIEHPFKDEDVLEFIKQTVDKFDDFRKCSAVAICGRKFGISFVNLLQTFGIICPGYQLKIDIQDLIGKSFENNRTIKQVVQIIHLIMEMKKPTENFKSFGKEAKAPYQILASESQLLWLSQDNYFEKIFNLQEDIIHYIKVKDEPDIAHYQDLFEDSHFLSELAFLADLTTVIERWNLNLHQSDQCIADLINNFRGFRNKLQILMKQIEQNELSELSCCHQLVNMCSINLSEFIPVVENIIKEIDIRFPLFFEMEADIKLFDNPLSARLEYQRAELQFELCCLQADSILIGKRLRGIEFFKMLNQEHYPKLKDFGLRIFSMFGSTQICENASSFIRNNAFFHIAKNSVACNEFLRVGVSRTPVNTLELIRNRKNLLKSGNKI